MAEKKTSTNLFTKINNVKEGILKASLKKSWVNKFSWFSYYELGDIIPTIVMLCRQEWIFTSISYTEDVATLTIYDCENPEQFIETTSPMRSVELKGCNQIQALGWVETYQRRYLYMSAFDIVENDMFDAVAGSDKAPAKASSSNFDNEYNNFIKKVNDLDTNDSKQVEETLAMWRTLISNKECNEARKKEITEICIGIKEIVGK